MTIPARFSEVLIEDQSGDLLDGNINICQVCTFCRKESLVHPKQSELIKSLLGHRKFYCAFCLRHDFHTKKKKDILILSMRGIIGYLYYNNYAIKDNTMYVSEIEDLINSHIEIGLANPLFSYDPESYCWFVNFSKVGANQPGKVSVDEVINTVIELVSAFNLYDHILDFKGNKLIAKFEEAILDFYKKRYRPEGRRILSPTLAGCIQEPVVVASNAYTPPAGSYSGTNQNNWHYQNTPPAINKNNKTTTTKKSLPDCRDFLPKDLKILSRR